MVCFCTQNSDLEEFHISRNIKEHNKRKFYKHYKTNKIHNALGY